MDARYEIALGMYDSNRLDELVHMWRASFEAGVGITDPHPLSEQRHYFLTEVLPKNEVRLALRGDELVGFVAATSESVSQLYVRVGFWRHGIGRQLLQWAKTNSNGSLWLYTFSQNSTACTFYERNGFVPVERGFEPHWKLPDVKYRWVARDGGKVRVLS